MLREREFLLCLWEQPASRRTTLSRIIFPPPLWGGTPYSLSLLAVGKKTKRALRLALVGSKTETWRGEERYNRVTGVLGSGEESGDDTKSLCC